MSLLIYQMVFGTDSGQVHCTFHDDDNVSAGIGPEGQYNCFACSAKAHSPVSFVQRYFSVNEKKARYMLKAFERAQKYQYKQYPITDEHRKYLHSVGITDDTLIDKYMYSTRHGQLTYNHLWNGFIIGGTWFNAPVLSSYNASASKYKYHAHTIGGTLTPMDDVLRYNTLIITEGEKDMLVAKTNGVVNAVAKIGGANAYLLGGVSVANKNIIIIYDCDDAGRTNAIKDADYLTTYMHAKVKVIDLGLQNAEDLADYFVKYNHSKQDLDNLIRSTPIHVPQEITPASRIESYLRKLSKKDLQEVQKILNDINKEEESD